jgi:transposase
MTDRSRVSAGSKMEPEVSFASAELSDEQWALIADLFPSPAPDPRGGRPRADARHCLEGILWVLRSGARWKDLPRSFPSYVTCWRRFAEWSVNGVWDRAWERLVSQLSERGEVNWEEGFADGTFSAAKKGAIASVPPSVAKAASSWFWSTETACHWQST